jgi:myo-inositol-1(or 4)-monophosphatase
MDNYFPLLVSFVREAGEMALSLIQDSSPQLKPDTSVITRADKAISVLARERFQGLLASSDHILIDEEDPGSVQYLDQSVLDKVPFLWAIDPIDATRAYANRMPHYGISLGLMKDLYPWMGAVFFPSLKELFYCDGKEAFFVQHAFTKEEKRTRIVPWDEEISSRSVFIVTDDIMDDFTWQSRDCRIMVFSAAVCEFCWPAVGRGCGALSKVHLWDMAGAWPVFEKAGLRLRSFSTGEVLSRVEARFFHKDKTPWRLKDYYILSSDRNYDQLRQRLKAKS